MGMRMEKLFPNAKHRSLVEASEKLENLATRIASNVRQLEEMVNPAKLERDAAELMQAASDFRDESLNCESIFKQQGLKDWGGR